VIFDVAILGMGTDGHTASFFPDAEHLEGLLDSEAGHRVLPVHAPSAKEPRLTLSMPVLCRARFVVLHIEGAEKRSTLETALGDGGPMPPIRTVVDAAAAPVHIYWSP
jgi:6-phosphogluconolactonase